MKNYKQFIRSGNVSESIISDTFKSVGSLLRGDKKEISGYLQSIYDIEKDYIDRSDELGYDIFLSTHTKTLDPVEASRAKQKGIMSKRAIDSMSIAKNSEISSIMSKIGRICRRNPGLLDFYKKEKSDNDAKIAKYAYQKARKFNDDRYDTRFYDIWKDKEKLSDDYSLRRGFSDRDDTDTEFDDVDEYDITTYTDLGSFGVSIPEFNELIDSIPREDIKKLLISAQTLKYHLDVDYEKKKATNTWKRNNTPNDFIGGRINKERMDALKQAHTIASDKILNKISIIKGKLKIKEP